MDRIGYFSSFQALKTDTHFASIFGPFPGSFSPIYQAVTLHTITGCKFYCQIHKKNPEVPEKISRCSSKNFSVFHEKFWPVSRDHFACHFKVIWPVPRFAFVPKWTKLQAGKYFSSLENSDFSLREIFIFVLLTGVAWNIKISEGKKPAFLTLFVYSSIEEKGFWWDKNVFVLAQ